MAPTPVPDTDFYDITGNQAVIRPTGDDDWDNIQTVITALVAAGPGAKLRFSGGSFYSSYMIDWSDFDGEVFGAGEDSTVIHYGTADAPIAYLDATDRHFWQPNGWPCAMVFHETDSSGTPINTYMHDLSVVSSGALGYTGVNGGAAWSNLGVEAILKVVPSNPMVTVFDAQRTLTGTTASTVLAAGMEQPVVVTSAADLGGTIYTEGVDYTVDLGAGTITRIALGAIVSGSTVFVTYHNGPNIGMTASVARLKLERCRIGGSSVNVGGISMPDTDRCLFVCNGVGVRRRSDATSVTVNAVYTSVAALAGLLWDHDETATRQPLNAHIEVRDCRFNDSDVAMQFLGIDGVPVVTGGYTFPATAYSRGRVLVEGCDILRCGWGGLSFFTINATGFGTGTDYIFRDNDFDTVTSAIRFRSDAPNNSLVGTSHAPLFEGQLESCIMDNNRVVNWAISPDEFGGSQYQCFELRAQSGTATNTLGVVISNNTIDSADPNTSTNPIRARHLNDAKIFGNKVTTREGVRGAAPVFVNNVTDCLVAGNDFSACGKAAGVADVLIESGASNVVVQANENDLIEDQGTNSLIIGGTISSLVH